MKPDQIFRWVLLARIEALSNLIGRPAEDSDIPPGSIFRAFLTCPGGCLTPAQHEDEPCQSGEAHEDTGFCSLLCIPKGSATKSPRESITRNCGGAGS